MKLPSRVWLFVTPWMAAYQAPQSMGFPRQEYWSGLPFPSPGDLPNPGIEPGSPALQTDALPSKPDWGLTFWVQILGSPVCQVCEFWCKHFPFFKSWCTTKMASLMAQMVKNLPGQCRRPRFDPPGSWRSSGEGNGYPLQYSCHGQSSLVGYSPWGHRTGQNWTTNTKIAVPPTVTVLWLLLAQFSSSTLKKIFTYLFGCCAMLSHSVMANSLWARGL